MLPLGGIEFRCGGTDNGVSSTTGDSSEMKRTTSTDLEIPANEAWQLLGNQFGENGDWTSFLTSSYIDGPAEVGATRVCHNRDKITTEKITVFEPQNMKLTYVLADDMPRWLKSSPHTWTVTPRGIDKSTVTSDLVVNLKWWALPLTPVLHLVLGFVVRRVQKEFKHWAETGTPTERKQAHLLKHAKWRSVEVPAPSDSPT